MAKRKKHKQKRVKEQQGDHGDTKVKRLAHHILTKTIEPRAREHLGR